MSEKINGIVLKVRKYNDCNNIVILYTRERGRIAFISPMGSGKASNVRRARLQPLALISTDLKNKANVELQRLGSISTPELWSDIYFHPAKRAIALFLSEFLDHLLNVSMADTALYDFLLQSLRYLDRLDTHIANYHIAFLVSLLTYSGIQPDVSGYQPGKVFEFSSGSFTGLNEVNGPYLEGEEAKAVEFVSRINFSNMKSLRLTSMNRRQILYGLLNYYSFHFPGLGSLKSPEVLREIFG